MAPPAPFVADLVDALPAALDAPILGLAAWQWLGLLLATAAAWLAGVVVAAIVLGTFARLTARTRAAWDDRLLAAMRGPARLFLGLLAFVVIVGALGLPAGPAATARLWIQAAVVVTAAWAVLRAARFAGDLLERRVTRDAGDDVDAAVRARAVRTQVRVVVRVVDVVVVVLAAALVLLQFDVVRDIGASLLASAGLAGIVVGLAAQKTIGGVVAGLQLSLTQPVRIGDTVIVEGEWGTIEEITLTYLVVRVWDERRLVVPISRFLDQPFQNWTRRSTQLLGTVFFHADYRLPIDDVRAALDRIVEGHPKWDGRVKGVVVTDTTEHTMQVRALVSARNAGDQWDLRCHVREELLAWLRAHEGGRYLPRTRLEGAEAAIDGPSPG